MVSEEGEIHIIDQFTGRVLKGRQWSDGLHQAVEAKEIYDELKALGYGIEKDSAKLADILGHSSINTTRIYIMTTGTEHLRRIERLGLVI